MKIIHRYILKEILSPFLVGVSFFTLLFIAPKLKTLVGLNIEKGIPLTVVLQLLIYILPATTVLTIPMGTLFGTLFSLSRLSGNNEITAMRAMGISLWSISKPILCFGLFMSLFLFLFFNFIMSRASLRYKTLYTNAVYASPGILLQEQTFITLPGETKQMTALSYNEKTKIMRSIYIFDQKENQETSLIYAQKGQWVSNEINSSFTKLHLENGEIIRLDGQQEKKIERIKFDKMEINLFIEIKQIELADKGIREYSIFELWKAMKNLGPPETISPIIWVEFHKKISIPLACLIFVIISIPLAITNARSGKGASLGLTLIVIFIYYVFLNSGEATGKYGFIPPAIGMYMPNIVVGAVGIFLFIKKIRE